MSRIQHHIPPKLPTALAGHANLDLPAYDICQYIVESVHVLPIKLNVSRFEEALSRVLQLYPHAAGRLRCADGRWFIGLANAGVPVDIDYKLDTTSETLLNGNWVVQDDLAPFLSHHTINAHSVNDGGPLLSLKLTFFDNETCVGVSWHHVLGDAMLILRFMHMLSQFYQGLPQEYPSPTFEKYHFPKPSSAMLVEFWPWVSHLHIARPLGGLAEAYAEVYRDFEHLRWRIDNNDLAELRSELSSRAPGGSYLSRQDCLTAYVVAVLNYGRSTPVETITNLTSLRNINAPFIAENVASSLTLNVPAAVPADIAGIATALRHALVQGRKPDRIHNVMSVASEIILETVNAGKVFDMCQRDDTIFLVNSNAVINWCSAHFGCPDGAQFYTSGMGKYFLRCFRSNPIKGDDGAWHPRQSIDISTGVLAELKPRLLETFARGIQFMLDEEDQSIVQM